MLHREDQRIMFHMLKMLSVINYKRISKDILNIKILTFKQSVSF